MAVFGKSPDEKQERIMSDMINRVNENVQRLRVIEQKIQAIDLRINSTEQSMVSYNKNAQKELSEKDAKIAEVEERLEKMETAYNEILKQLKMAATKANVDELKELVSIYDPMKSSFVTKEEMEKFFEEKQPR
jgi:ABC-type phosphate transport system auxiliary subunit